MLDGPDQPDTTLHVLSRVDFTADRLAGPRRLYVSANVGRLWRAIRGWPGPVQAWGSTATRVACFAKPSKVVGVAPPAGPNEFLPVRWLECHTEQAARRAAALGYAPGAIRRMRPVLNVPESRHQASDTLRVLIAPMPSWRDNLRSAVLAAAVLRVTGRPMTLVSHGRGPMSTVLARLSCQMEQPDIWHTTDVPFEECVTRCHAYLNVARGVTDPLPWRTARAAGLPVIHAGSMPQRRIAQRLVQLFEARGISRVPC
ncbi:MAG: hypothetical protein AAGD32_10450 [Planctomycetota bacterium]